MPGLMDLGPMTESVDIGGGKTMDVRGLSVDDLFFLINNFEEVRALVTRNLKALTVEKLMEGTPRMLATITACASDQRDNLEAVNRAMTLGAHVQLRIIRKVFTLTFPDGLGPFVDDMVELQNAFVPSTSSASPTEASATPSPPELSAALQMDAASVERYRPHRAN